MMSICLNISSVNCIVVCKQSTCRWQTMWNRTVGRLTANGKETPYLELVTATGNLRYTFRVPRKVK